MSADPRWMLYAGKLWRYNIYEQGRYGQVFSLFFGLPFLFHPLTQVTVDNASGLTHASSSLPWGSKSCFISYCGFNGGWGVRHMATLYQRGPLRVFQVSGWCLHVHSVLWGTSAGERVSQGSGAGWSNELQGPASPAVSCKTFTHSAFRFYPTSLRSLDASCHLSLLGTRSMLFPLPVCSSPVPHLAHSPHSSFMISTRLPHPPHSPVLLLSGDDTDHRQFLLVYFSVCTY